MKKLLTYKFNTVMKTMMRQIKWNFIFLWILSCMIPAWMMGQNPSQKNEKSQKREKFQAMKVAYFTEKLQLTEEEAAKFWPVFNAFEDEMRELRKEHQRTFKQRKEEDILQLPPAEADVLIKKHLELKQRELDLEKKYLVKFMEILPKQKVVMLLKAQKDFGRFIMSQLRKGDERPPHPMD